MRHLFLVATSSTKDVTGLDIASITPKLETKKKRKEKESEDIERVGLEKNPNRIQVCCIFAGVLLRQTMATRPKQCRRFLVAAAATCILIAVVLGQPRPPGGGGPFGPGSALTALTAISFSPEIAQCTPQLIQWGVC
jgi:hypothetical protein